MYILLSLMGDLGSIYAIQVNSVAIGMIGLVGFGSYTIYLIIRISPLFSKLKSIFAADCPIYKDFPALKIFLYY